MCIIIFLDGVYNFVFEFSLFMECFLISKYGLLLYLNLFKNCVDVDILFRKVSLC